MKETFPKPRRVIKSFSPYAPGLSMEEVKEKYHLKEIIKMASNENLWGSSPSAMEEVMKELDKLHFYPQSVPVKLKQELAERLGLSFDSIILGNGTDEIIELIAKTFLTPDDKVVVSENSFIRYKMAGRLMDSEVIEIPQNNFRIDLEKILLKLDERTKIIFIDNPCNPTGTFITGREIENFIKELEKLKSLPLVVFDEAYIEYVADDSYCSAIEFFRKNIPLMVLRTFSKIYGLAGLRIGYGASSPKIISWVEKIRPPFNTNRLAQAAALGAIKDEDFIKKVSDETGKEKKFLYRELDNMGIKFIKSETNFILIKFGADAVEPICEHLLKKGIILRPLKGYHLDDYIRITIGKRIHNEKLIDGLKNFLNPGGYGKLFRRSPVPLQKTNG